MMIKNREPDVIEYGNQIWYDEDGKKHNENGFPAIIYFWGTKVWYKHGQKHNEFGPAIIYHTNLKEWYIDDIEYSEEQFKQHKIKQFITDDKE